MGYSNLGPYCNEIISFSFFFAARFNIFRKWAWRRTAITCWWMASCDVLTRGRVLTGVLCGKKGAFVLLRWGEGRGGWGIQVHCCYWCLIKGTPLQPLPVVWPVVIMARQLAHPAHTEGRFSLSHCYPGMGRAVGVVFQGLLGLRSGLFINPVHRRPHPLRVTENKQESLCLEQGRKMNINTQSFQDFQHLSTNGHWRIIFHHSGPR